VFFLLAGLSGEGEGEVGFKAAGDMLNVSAQLE
jgi:hypothetical protein